MKLSDLMDCFQKLDEQSSRNMMIETLAVLFKSSGSPDEVRKIVYLSEGTLLPPFRSAVLGISEQLMARAISEAVGKDIEEVKELYRDTGDYGLAAEQMITWKSGGLSVSQAYDILLSLSEISGKGSIENKVTGLANFIKQMGPEEARYMLRVPIGKLRLGIGDPTIMDALSLAYIGDKSLRSVIENAYDLCADMGIIAYILCHEGPERLRKFDIRIGTPIRVELAERTETLEGIIHRLGKCSIEPKYDGFRCQVHREGDNVTIYTRNLEDATEMFPDVVEAALRQVKSRKVIFEGEAVSYDPDSGEFRPFQVTVQRKRKHLVEVKEEELPLRLMAFDCLYRDGENIMYEPYTKRREILIDMITPDDTIQVTGSLITDNAEDVITYFNEMISAGLEGIMAKNLDSPYRAGRRTYDWIKFKRSYQGVLRDTIDCTIVGYFAGRGRRAKWGIGSLLCAVYNREADKFETITRVASGLSDQGWLDMKKTLDEIRSDDKPARVDSVYQPNVWVEPVYVTEVLADEITRSPGHTAGRNGSKTGYALRFPRIVTPIRVDRKPEDSTTVEEVIHLHDIQKKG